MTDTLSAVLSNIVCADVEGKPEAVTLLRQMTGSVQRVFEGVGRELIGD